MFFPRSKQTVSVAVTLVLLALHGCSRNSQDERSPFFFVDRIAEAQASFNPTRFRSFRKDGRLNASITLDGETRRSFVPPLPSRLTFTLHVPPEPALRFAVAVLAPNEPYLPAPVEFRLYVDSGSGEEICFEKTVRLAESNRWLDRQVDLSRWTGSKIRLTFETKVRRPRAPSSGEDARSATSSLLALWGNPVLASLDPPAVAPNLVLVSIDCLRADHVGTYGYQRDTTPHIDALAEDGVVFENAVSTSSWTLPSHISMLTGLAPSFHGASRRHKLDRSVPYLPEMLAHAGYQVDAIVSGAFLFQDFGVERGFHTFRALDDPRAAVTIDAALERLRRSTGQAQFLFVHLYDPHWPYSPPGEFLGRFGSRPRDISDLNQKVAAGESPQNTEEKEQVIRLYDGEIAYVDQQVGRLLDALKSMGLYDRSLIVLTADHGEAFYEHGYWRHTLTLYDEIIRVPLIVKWPGQSPRGRVKAQVSQVDLFPTLLEQAGLPTPQGGALSLRQQVNKDVPTDSQRNLLSEVTWTPMSTGRTMMKIAFRTERFKYIATLVGPVENELAVSEIRDEELYDLSRDPAEQENLFPEAPLEVGSFRRLLRSHLDEARELRASRRGEEIVLDETLEQRLRALGYIE